MIHRLRELKSLLARLGRPASCRRAGRSLDPAVVGLESRVALTVFVEPPETARQPNPQFLTFNSDIKAEIDGSIGADNRPPEYTGQYPGQLNDYDGYTLKLNQPYLGEVSVRLTISGAPSAQLSHSDPLNSPKAYLFVTALDNFGGLLRAFQGTIDPLGGGSDTTSINIPIIRIFNQDLPIHQLRISVSGGGEYTALATAAPYKVVVESKSNDPPPPPPQLPDIAITSAAMAGSTVTYSYSAVGNAYPFTVSFYRSRDTLFNPDPKVDEPIGSQTVIATSPNPGRFGLPQSFGYDPNRPYLLAVADPAGQINESNEGNNVVTVAVPKPAPVDISVDSAAINGGTIRYTFHTTGNPGEFSVSLYQSAHWTFDASATPVTTKRVSSAPNSSGAGSFTLNFTPSPARPYFYVVADGTKLVPESNEANNSAIVVRKLAWGTRVSAEFRKKVVVLASQLRTDPSFLMAAMAFETGETFDPKKRNAAGSSAVGLIQFTRATAQSLGTTIEELAAMTAEEQLDFVAKYFKPYRGTVSTLSDVYMAILYPKAIGKGDAYVLFDRVKTPTAYTQNKGLDANRDGTVTKTEAAQKVASKLQLGLGSGKVFVMKSYFA